MIIAVLLSLLTHPTPTTTTMTTTTTATTTTTTTAIPDGFADADELVAKELAAARALGTYRLRFSKDERVNGRMTGVQVTVATIRQEPSFALYAEVTAGPDVGQRFLYNASLKKAELFVIDSGMLGFIGGLWLDINSSLTRENTNHPATNLGLAAVLRNVAGDRQKAKAHGGHARVDEGFDARGSWCMRFTAPPGAPNMYCEKSLICVDQKTFLLTHLEVADEKGVFENLTFDIVDRNLIVPDAAFTPEGASW